MSDSTTARTSGTNKETFNQMLKQEKIINITKRFLKFI